MFLYAGSLIPEGVKPHALEAADRLFSEADFLAFARGVFTTVHGAVAAKEHAVLERVTSAALGSSLWLRNGPGWNAPVNVIDHVAVLDASHAERDRITVRFGARIGAGQVVEDWVFERDAVAYRESMHLAATVCAVCGAPISTDERGDCRYCRTHIVGVAGSWQVAAVLPPRILQAQSGPSSADVLLPGHGRDDLLAFAASLYRRVCNATAAGHLAEVRVVTHDMRRRLQTDEELSRPVAALGDVQRRELVYFERVAFELATVRLWILGEAGAWLEDWTFERPAALPSRVQPSDCPCCGAPLRLDERGDCRQCHTHLFGVAGDWRLSNIAFPRPTITHPWLIRALQSRTGQLALFGFLLLGLALTVWLLTLV